MNPNHAMSGQSEGERCVVCGNSGQPERGEVFSMRSLTLLSWLLAAALLSGCATYQEAPPPVNAASLPRPLSLAEIREMSARGVSEGTILTALQASRAMYQLDAEDVAALQEAGVSQTVIDYLLRTPEMYKAEPPRPPTYSQKYPSLPGWRHGYHTWHH